MKKNIVFNWIASRRFGWGVYGANLALYWPDKSYSLYSSCPAHEDALYANPFEKIALAEFVQGSNFFAHRLLHAAEPQIRFDGLCLHAIGWSMKPLITTGGKEIRGDANVAVVFSEQIDFSMELWQRTQRYDLFIAGSQWQRQLLEHYGIGPVKTVLQGVDPTLFHPGPRSGLLEDRFLIFSGGKMELRKAQDLVLRAFGIFAQRHAEAVLVTAWDSPWPQYSASLGKAETGLEQPRWQDGKIDILGWATANGIAPDQVIDLGKVSQEAMGRVLRDVDVAVFPNRCEAGTNLVAMECMACGVPTILSANTGHLDLIGDGQAIPLRRQRINEAGVAMGWGESDVEEIVEALEGVWRDRQGAAEIGRRGAAFLQGLSWKNQIGQLAEAIIPLWGE